MALRFGTDMWRHMTMEQIWGNFETDLYQCEDDDLAQRIMELGGKKLFKDYLNIKNAMDNVGYLNCVKDPVEDEDNELFIKPAKHYVDVLNKMTKRKKIHPKQKQMAVMVKNNLKEKLDAVLK